MNFPRIEWGKGKRFDFAKYLDQPLLTTSRNVKFDSLISEKITGVDRITSKGFSDSLSVGYGWGVYKPNDNIYTLSIPKVIIRNSLDFWDLSSPSVNALSIGTAITGLTGLSGIHLKDNSMIYMKTTSYDTLAYSPIHIEKVAQTQTGVNGCITGILSYETDPADSANPTNAWVAGKFLVRRNQDDKNIFSVIGEAISSGGGTTVAVGVYGKASGGTYNWGGYFANQVYVDENIQIDGYLKVGANGDGVPTSGMIRIAHNIANSTAYGIAFGSNTSDDIFLYQNTNTVLRLSQNLIVDGYIKANSNYVMEGYATGRNVDRNIKITITGQTDNTQLKVSTVNKFNGQILALETIDTDTPTGGTRFDISADGLTLTLKGITPATIGVGVGVIEFNDTGVAAYTPVLDIASDKITIQLFNAITGAAVNMAAAAEIPNNKLIRIVINYKTST